MPAFIPANGAIEGAISIAVLVIAFIGWLVQIAGAAKAQPQPKPPAQQNRPRPPAQRPAVAAGNRPQPKRRDERLQSEIDAFLREVSGGRKPRSQPVEDDVAIEIIEDEESPDEAPRRLAPSSRTVPPIVEPPAAAGQDSDWDREQQRRRERLVSTLAERHLESTPLAADLRKHVEQTMAESLRFRQEKEQAEKHLAEARAEIQSMRAQTAAGPGAGPVGAGGSARGPSRFAALLKNRRGVKEAIVINEVLGRPKGLSRHR